MAWSATTCAKWCASERPSRPSLLAPAFGVVEVHVVRAAYAQVGVMQDACESVSVWIDVAAAGIGRQLHAHVAHGCRGGGLSLHRIVPQRVRALQQRLVQGAARGAREGHAEQQSDGG